MISITTKELEIANDLKRKIEFICDFWLLFTADLTFKIKDFLLKQM